MSQINPYEAPRSQVADVPAAAGWGSFVEGGRAVEAGRGWSWIAEGFALFRKRPGAWILIAIILGVVVILTNLVPVLGGLAYMLLAPVLGGGLLLGCRELERDGEFGVRHLFAGFSHETGRLVAVGALTIVGWLIIMVPMMLMMGTSFLALMGGNPEAIAAAGPTLLVGSLISLALSVPLVMALWFAPSLVVFRAMAPQQAFARSFRASLKNIVPFLVYSIVMMVLFIVAAIPLGLGFLVLIPVLVASLYTSYRDIFYAPA